MGPWAYAPKNTFDAEFETIMEKQRRTSALNVRMSAREGIIRISLAEHLGDKPSEGGGLAVR